VDEAKRNPPVRIAVDSGGNSSASIHPTRSSIDGRIVTQFCNAQYKAGWDPLAVLHTICAFANDFHNFGGGYIVLGVKERNGRAVLPPVGLEPAQIDRIQKELLNLGFNAIQPYYHPIAVPAEIDRREISPNQHAGSRS